MTEPVPEHGWIPRVLKKAINPPGSLPRNAQAWFIGGVSLLMVLVIAFTGGKQPKGRKVIAEPPLTATVDPDQARIQEYRKRIEEQARKLAAEQSQLVEARQNLGLAPTPATSPAASPAGPSSFSRYSPPDKSWIEADKEKREYQALFASNVALSFRPEVKMGDSVLPAGAAGLVAPTPPNVPNSVSGFSAWPVPPSVATPGTNGATIPGQSASNVTNENAASTAQSASVSANARAKERDRELDRAAGKDYRLFEGAVIETVLTNRLDGAFSGPVNCMVTSTVYSHDRQHVLIPQGSRILGEVKRVDTFGQERLAVLFHRLIMPDGYSVSLDQFHGLNQIGETGLRDQVNHHYMQIFGVSIAIGAIAGLSQSNTQYGADASALDAYRQGVATSLSQSSLRILDKYLNVLPTFTIREGQRVKVYLSDDLLLPAYEKHQMPNDL